MSNLRYTDSEYDHSLKVSFGGIHIGNIEFHGEYHVFMSAPGMDEFHGWLLSELTEKVTELDNNISEE